MRATGFSTLKLGAAASPGVALLSGILIEGCAGVLIAISDHPACGD